MWIATYNAKSKAKGSEHKELLGIVISNANRLKKLSEDILDVTKIESNTLELILLRNFKITHFITKK